MDPDGSVHISDKETAIMICNAPVTYVEREAVGTAYMGSFLKEISVIVSVALASHDFAPKPATGTRPRKIHPPCS